MTDLGVSLGLCGPGIDCVAMKQMQIGLLSCPRGNLVLIQKILHCGHEGIKFITASLLALKLKLSMHSDSCVVY